MLTRWLAAAALALLAACTAPQAPRQEAQAPPAPHPAPVVAPPEEDITRLDHPIIVSGDAALVAARPEQPATAAGEAGDITLNFVDTDVREVVRSVLGDVLHLNYAVDPKVQGTVTLQTSRPLRREEVLPTLQVALRTSGLALVETAGVERVVPLEEAAHSGSEPLIVGQGRPPAQASANYNVQIFPLKYIAAQEMRQMVEPLLPKGTVIEVDTTRNLLILSGNGQDLSTAADMVKTFDVDWLKGMSFGIFPLEFGTPRAVSTELNSIFGPNGSVPLAGVLRFAPLERMNAILAVSPQRAYLEQARQWVERLDKGGDDNTPRLFEYHVQNSRAADLAKVLSELFGGQVRTVGPSAETPESFTQQGGGFGGGTGGGFGAGGPFGSAPSSTPTLPGMPPGLSPSPLGGAPGGGAPSPLPTGQPQPSGTQSSSTAGTASSRSQQSQGLASALGTAFGADRTGLESQFAQVRIVADEKNNTLVIYAPPRQYRMIADALKRLDVVPLQVLIEATIAEVTLNDNLQYGTQFFIKRGGSNFTLTQGAAAGVPPQIFPGFNYAFLAAGINVVLSALSAVTDVDVVSSPQLLVLDHHEATLQVGDEVPVLTAQIQQTVTNGAPVVNTVSYLNTGVILHVSPRVNQNGVITLDISQEVSDVATTTSGVTGSPTINQRRVETTVSVLDGQTVALGGLIRENRTLSNTGLPVLKDVPVFGSLFGTKENQKGRTELLVLLSPRVLHDAAEAHAATEELRGRLHTIAPIVGRVR